MKRIISFLLATVLLSACTGPSTGEGAASGLPGGTFSDQQTGSYSGDIYVRGYADVQRVQEPFCQDDCETFDYVFFHILASGNATLDDFFTLNEGNAYVQPNAVGLGCRLENGTIQYTNLSVAYQMREFTLSYPESQAILQSSKNKPIELQLIKLPMEGGTEAPACYSHFTLIKVRE